MRRVGRWAFASVLVGSLLFVLAGTWRDPWLWAYVVAFSCVGVFAVRAMDEDLARERFHPPSAGADRLSLRAIRVIALAHVVVGALDSGRFHWSTVHPALRLVGLVGFALSFALIARAMLVNRFFSAVVRLQSDRGHHVVDRGPYRIVRHPGYAGMIPAVPFSALALGSWVAFAIALVYSVLILKRVIFEDQFLHTHLPGYAEYAARVRYRLVPGAW